MKITRNALREIIKEIKSKEARSGLEGSIDSFLDLISTSTNYNEVEKRNQLTGMILDLVPVDYRNDYKMIRIVADIIALTDNTYQSKSLAQKILDEEDFTQDVKYLKKYYNAELVDFAADLVLDVRYML
tara:strand:+ start:929 stop:1315 length:387 start_codon:yes stop_codon:yes gene_type:complete